MHTLLISTTILFTSISAVGIGIGAGYAAISAILAAFGHHPGRESVVVPPQTAAQPSR